MSIRRLILASSLAASLLVPFAAGAVSEQAHDSRCALASYKVTRVAPYWTEERVGRGTIRRLAGAELFIGAERGLSREFVEATVRRHLEQMRTSSMPGCPLDVDRIRVSVVTGGTGYWVRIAGKDTTAAKEILAWAQHLVR